MNSLPALTPLPLRFLELLSHLVRNPSVVGAEHAFFRCLQRELEERGATVNWYEGLLVAQGRRPHSLMLSAHIDRHGLVCTGPNEFQFAAFVAGARSDLLGNSVSEQLLRKVRERYVGQALLAYEPWSGVYRGGGTIVADRMCEYRNNLIFEVQGLEHLVAGTPVAFADRLHFRDDQFLYAQLDNVLSAAIQVYLFELGFEGTAFFTAQEEIGKSWRYLLEWFRRFGGKTNRLLVLDTSPFNTESELMQYDLVLRHADANAEFDPETTAQLGELSQQLGYQTVFKDDYIRARNALLPANQEPQTLGSTEMGRIIAASGGVVTGSTLQIPTIGYHTTAETARFHSVAAALNLLQSFWPREG